MSTSSERTFSADEWEDLAAFDPDELQAKRERSQVQKQLEWIAQEQSALPTCGLCGQRANRLDEFGLCSKVTPSHADFRSGKLRRR